ncbi:MAG: transcription elongation factor subunit Spt4 [Candidatus Woesearchaeota archaeon]|nr:transcription elongation factor subunit Spt4 [Candidatus Woesearchaeota archaeon]
MGKKKACKRCRLLFEESECPSCKSALVSTVWHGRLHILDPEHSVIAKKCGFDKKGEYAIKIR